MDHSRIQETILDLLKENELEQAVSELEKYLNESDVITNQYMLKLRKEELILIQTRLNEYHSHYLNGTETVENLRVERLKMTRALLEVHSSIFNNKDKASSGSKKKTQEFQKSIRI